MRNCRVMPSWKQTDSKIIWENVILIKKNYIGAAEEHPKKKYIIIQCIQKKTKCSIKIYMRTRINK